jgi:hypothetical protein
MVHISCDQLMRGKWGTVSKPYQSLCLIWTSMLLFAHSLVCVQYQAPVTRHTPDTASVRQDGECKSGQDCFDGLAYQSFFESTVSVFQQGRQGFSKTLCVTASRFQLNILKSNVGDCLLWSRTLSHTVCSVSLSAFRSLKPHGKLYSYIYDRNISAIWLLAEMRIRTLHNVFDSYYKIQNSCG